MVQKASILIILLAFAGSCSKSTLPEGFVYADEYIPGLVIDIRYFSNDNFVGDTIDGYQAARCIMTKEAAKALKSVQTELNSIGFGIKIFDAYRPQRAVDHFVRWAEDPDDTLMKAQYYPDVEKGKLFQEGYIAAKSGHSRGSTVDLSIIYLEGREKGKELDMGSPWDYFGNKSWPSSTAVKPDQRANRMLLRRVMQKHGFAPMQEEWWHFTLKDEPFPDTYFDFVVI